MPEGAFTVGIGMVVAGITMYGFLAVSARALGPVKYPTLGVLWALNFLVGPGLFFSLEQELARQVASRLTQGLEIGPLFLAAAGAGARIAGALALLSLLVLQLPIETAFDASLLVVAAWMLLLFGAFVEHLVRGLLAGERRFHLYSAVIGGAGILRLLLCTGLAGLGVDSPGMYGIALGLGVLVAVPIGLHEYASISTDHHSPVAASFSLRRVLHFATASFTAYALLNAPIVAATLLTRGFPRALAGQLIASFAVVRVPLFLFQAIQATTVPALAASLASNQYARFRRATQETVALVAISSGAFLVFIAFWGHELVELVFGSSFALNVDDMVLLAIGGLAFLAALALAQSLIVLSAPAPITLSWCTGLAVFGLSYFTDLAPLRTVEWAFLAASVSSCCIMGLSLRRRAVRRASIP